MQEIPVLVSISVSLHVQILLALSDNQVQDIMLLRQLYHNKLGLLRLERKELVSQMTSVEEQAPHPCEHVVTMSDMSTCLKENAYENHQTLYRVARVLYRGVSHAGLLTVCCFA